jgi:sulfate adenylyltransferase
VRFILITPISIENQYFKSNYYFAPLILMNELAVKCTNFEIPNDITLDERNLNDLEMFFLGAFDPLQGYNTFENFNSIVTHGCLEDGTIWPIPFVLPVPECLLTKNNNSVSTHSNVFLNVRDVLGTIVARVSVVDCYKVNIDVYGQLLLETSDTNHPFMDYLHNNHRDSVYVGGNITPICPIKHFDFIQYRQNTKQVKDMIRHDHWDAVIGFQTRNPMHKSHFELTRQAVSEVQKELETSNTSSARVLLLITPSCGVTQPGDIDSATRIRCYQKILPYYKDLYNIDVKLVVLPLTMRMAGPKEALWHALIRQNFGCTHFIIGRDHAGPSCLQKNGKSFYEPYAAHALLKSFATKLKIIPILSMNMVYVPDKKQYVQENLLPPNASYEQLSGTKFRTALQNREPIPEWFSFPTVLEELKKVYHPRYQQGFCIYFTGLPCSGKSTLAKAVSARLEERESENRHVSILDADIVRLHLSRGLGYSKQDRSVNVQRIGYVASLITYHYGIVLVANIAPYAADRLSNRRLITNAGGGYIEVYVSTPLSICQTRDVKQHYKNARLGVLKQVIFNFFEQIFSSHIGIF